MRDALLDCGRFALVSAAATGIVFALADMLPEPPVAVSDAPAVLMSTISPDAWAMAPEPAKADPDEGFVTAQQALDALGVEPDEPKADDRPRHRHRHYGRRG